MNKFSICVVDDLIDEVVDILEDSAMLYNLESKTESIEVHGIDATPITQDSPENEVHSRLLAKIIKMIGEKNICCLYIDYNLCDDKNLNGETIIETLYNFFPYIDINIISASKIELSKAGNYMPVRCLPKDDIGKHLSFENQYYIKSCIEIRERHNKYIDHIKNQLQELLNKDIYTELDIRNIVKKTQMIGLSKGDYSSLSIEEELLSLLIRGE